VYRDQAVERFRGPVKSWKKLPKAGYLAGQAKAGDAFYVEDIKALVVGTSSGWLRLDGDDS
jgi:hypothetical protein